MPRKLAASFLLTLLIVGSGRDGTAQSLSTQAPIQSADSTQARAGWLSLGAAILADRVYLLGGLNMQRGVHLYTLRAALYDIGTGSEDFSEYGILLGRARSRGRVFGSGAAGLGVLAHTSYDGCGWGAIYECRTKTLGRAVGLLFEANSALRLGSQGAGAGLTVFGNLNSMRHLAGATLTIHLGRW